MFLEKNQTIQYMPRVSVQIYTSPCQMYKLFNFKDLNMIYSSEILKTNKAVRQSEDGEGFYVDYFPKKEDRTRNKELFVQIRVEQKVKNTFNTFYRQYTMSISPHLPALQKNANFTPKILHTLPFICIRDKPGQDQNHYQLSYGDYIKLGNIFFKVIDIDGRGHSTKYTKQSSRQSSDQQYKIDVSNEETAMERSNHYMELQETEDQRKTCRYCLEQENKKNNLISLCKCRGTMEFVHLKCLKNWRLNHVQQRKESSRVFKYIQKSFKCQICKTPYSSIIQDSNCKNSLICNFVRPNAPHIILEHINEQIADRDIYVLSSNQQSTTVRIGSGKECDLRINDKSIEQIHASIIFCDNRVYLSDMDSMFGTSRLLQREEIVEQGQQIVLLKQEELYKFQLQTRVRRPKVE